MRLIDGHELKKRVPYSPVHIRRLEQAGKFPKRVKLGKNRVAWVEAEVESWCQARVDERDGVPVGRGFDGALEVGPDIALDDGEGIRRSCVERGHRCEDDRLEDACCTHSGVRQFLVPRAMS